MINLIWCNLQNIILIEIIMVVKWRVRKVKDTNAKNVE